MSVGILDFSDVCVKTEKRRRLATPRGTHARTSSLASTRPTPRQNRVPRLSISSPCAIPGTRSARSPWECSLRRPPFLLRRNRAGLPFPPRSRGTPVSPAVARNSRPRKKRNSSAAAAASDTSSSDDPARRWTIASHRVASAACRSASTACCSAFSARSSAFPASRTPSSSSSASSSSESVSTSESVPMTDSVSAPSRADLSSASCIPCSSPTLRSLNKVTSYL